MREYNLQDSAGLELLAQCCQAVRAPNPCGKLSLATGRSSTEEPAPENTWRSSSNWANRAFVARTIAKLGLSFQAVRPFPGRPGGLGMTAKRTSIQRGPGRLPQPAANAWRRMSELRCEQKRASELIMKMCPACGEYEKRGSLCGASSICARGLRGDRGTLFRACSRGWLCGPPATASHDHRRDWSRVRLRKGVGEDDDGDRDQPRHS